MGWRLATSDRIKPLKRNLAPRARFPRPLCRLFGPLAASRSRSRTVVFVFHLDLDSFVQTKSRVVARRSRGRLSCAGTTVGGQAAPSGLLLEHERGHILVFQIATQPRRGDQVVSWSTSARGQGQSITIDDSSEPKHCAGFLRNATEPHKKPMNSNVCEAQKQQPANAHTGERPDRRRSCRPYPRSGPPRNEPAVSHGVSVHDAHTTLAPRSAVMRAI